MPRHYLDASTTNPKLHLFVLAVSLPIFRLAQIWSLRVRMAITLLVRGVVVVAQAVAVLCGTGAVWVDGVVGVVEGLVSAHPSSSLGGVIASGSAHIHSSWVVGAGVVVGDEAAIRAAVLRYMQESKCRPGPPGPMLWGRSV